MGSSGALAELRNGQWAKLEAEGRILGKNVENAVFLRKNAATEFHATLKEGLNRPTECPKGQTKTAIWKIAFFPVLFIIILKIENEMI
jgi:hypothetical protein